jgi:murein DD-endopeptidase MepM/ murein hydrolase activator NlpD
LWVRQTLICLAILALALVGKSLEKYRPVGVAMQAVRYTIGTDYDFKNAWAKLPSMQTIGGRNLSEVVDPWLERLRSFLHLEKPAPADHQMVLPVEGTVTSTFGVRAAAGKTEQHSGLDIAAPTGTDIVAALAGQVTKVGLDDGYGRVVVVDHGRGLTTLYAQCSETNVQERQEVLPGQVIGKVGQTGDADGPSLHFEVRVNGKAVDPSPWLPISPGS